MNKEEKKDILNLKKKLLSLRVKKSSGEVQDTSVFKKTRKDIARLFTKVNKKEGK
jgi:ribosomal protein L29